MGLYKDTKILLSNGKLCIVKNLKVGDYIMGYNSKSYKINKIKINKEKIYKIESELTKDLFIDNKQEIVIKHNDQLKKILISSPEMRESILFSKNIVNFSFSVDDITIDSYLLGYWFSLETKEDFINLNHIKIDDFYTINNYYLKSIKKMVKYYDDTGDYSNLKLKKNNIFLDYISKIINNKFSIPKEYKYSNIENRKKFIAGILDGCGDIVFTNDTKTVQIKLLNEKLSKDIEFILHSLGFFTNTIKIKYKNKKIIITIFIYGNFKDIPVLLKKNIKNKKFNGKDNINLSEFKKKDDSYTIFLDDCNYIFGEDFTIYSL